MTLTEIYRSAGRCDKGTTHSYIEAYERLLEPYRRVAVRVLEIGILNGDSLRMWERYFEDGAVTGIDYCDQPEGNDLRPLVAEGTHRLIFLDALCKSKVEKVLAGKVFDVIIEDACHDDQLTVYANFREHLAPGGIYIIEDVQRLDQEREAFVKMDPERIVSIIDRRHVKGRYDDVLVVIQAP